VKVKFGLGIVKKILDSERYKNILRTVTTMMMILSAYFLGMNAVYMTNEQIKFYCEEYIYTELMQNLSMGYYNQTVDWEKLFNITE